MRVCVGVNVSVVRAGNTEPGETRDEQNPNLKKTKKEKKPKKKAHAAGAVFLEGVTLCCVLRLL